MKVAVDCNPLNLISLNLLDFHDNSCRIVHCTVVFVNQFKNI